MAKFFSIIYHFDKCLALKLEYLKIDFQRNKFYLAPLKNNYTHTSRIKA